MNNQLFKVGDKVYYPLMSDKILTLLKHGEDTVNVDLGVGNFFELNGKNFNIIWLKVSFMQLSLTMSF